MCGELSVTKLRKIYCWVFLNSCHSYGQKSGLCRPLIRLLAVWWPGAKRAPTTAILQVTLPNIHRFKKNLLAQKQKFYLSWTRCWTRVPKSRGFESRPFRYQLATVDKLFVHVRLSLRSMTWYKSRGGDALPWEGNRRSGIGLVMRHGFQWFIHLRVHGLRKGDDHFLMGYGIFLRLRVHVALLVVSKSKSKSHRCKN